MFILTFHALWSSVDNECKKIQVLRKKNCQQGCHVSVIWNTNLYEILKSERKTFQMD